MPLPEGTAVITVTGTYSTITGSPVLSRRGRAPQVGFTPSAVITDSDGKIIYTQQAVVALLNADGQFSISLACTDNAGWSPAGWVWNVSEVIPDLGREYSILLPSTLGETVDISDLSPVTTAPAVSAYVLQSQVGAPSGVAGLDSAGHLLAGELPDLSGEYLSLAGGTLTGPLTLPGNPTAALQAAPKEYVDSAVADLAQVAGALSGTPSDPQVTGIQGTPVADPSDADGGTDYLRADGSWDVPPGAVASVNAQTGAVTLTAADVGADTSGAAAAAQSAAQAYAVSLQPTSGSPLALAKGGTGLNSAGSAGQTLITGTSGALAFADAPVDWVNAVTACGADPSGGTECHTEIQNAINAAGAGGTCYLPNGQYKIAGTLNITTNGTRLIGSGATTGSAAGAELQWAGGAAPMLSIAGTSQVQVRDIALNDNTGLATAGIALGTNTYYGTLANLCISGITAAGAAGISNLGTGTGIFLWLLEKVSITGCYNGVAINGTGVTPNAFTLSACEITNNANYGVQVGSGYNWTFTGGDYERNGVASWYLAGCTGFTIAGTYLEVLTGATGLLTAQDSGGRLCDVAIVGGYWNEEAPPGPSYFITCPASTVNRLTVTGTHFGGALSGGSSVADIHNGGGSNQGAYLSCHTSGTLIDTVGNFLFLGGAGTIDPTAAHILPDGTQAQGGNGIAADSGHVHPENAAWIATDYYLTSGINYKAWNFDVASASFSTFSTNPAAGTVYLARINIREPITISKIASWYVAPSGGSPANVYMGLYTSAGAELGITEEFITGIPGGVTTGDALDGISIGTQNLTPGYYYAAALIGTQGTTKGGWVCSGSAGISGAGPNTSLPAAGYRWAVNGTGASALPTGPSAFSLSLNTENAFSFWFALL
jgi:hypothetical protein